MTTRDLFLLVLVVSAMVLFAVSMWRTKRAPRSELEPTAERRKHRLHVMGLGRTEIGPRAAAKITVSPQRVFKPKLLSIPSRVAEHFDITEVRVSGDALSWPWPTNAAARSDKGTEDLHVDWPACEPGQTITIAVSNKSDQLRTFSGMLVGQRIRTDKPPAIDPSAAYGSIGEADDLLRELNVPLEAPEDCGACEDDMAAAEEVLRAMPKSLAVGMALKKLSSMRNPQDDVNSSPEDRIISHQCPSCGAWDSWHSTGEEHELRGRQT